MICKNPSTPFSICREITIPSGDATRVDRVGERDVLQTKILKVEAGIVVYRILPPSLQDGRHGECAD